MMRGKTFVATAPSNIALIKYMGKNPGEVNQATNASISYTLPHLITQVSLTVTDSKDVQWQPDLSFSTPIQLSESGQKKFLRHWERCCQRLAPRFDNLQFSNLHKGVLITSGNNFPSDCGLASSASSFAALTLAAHKMFQALEVLDREWTLTELAQLSREGSGSSCRSFFEPWVFWSGNEVRRIECPSSEWGQLLHTVVIVDEKKKKVSSSEAHQRVLTSALFEGRVARAELRASHLENLLKKSITIDGDFSLQRIWNRIFEIAWSEFWDMHALFETSSPPFYYLTPKSLVTLRYLQEEWEKSGDGPLITMDAGPNVHLLYRSDQRELRNKQRAHLRSLDLLTLSEDRND